jgi:hypothetical protein
MNRFWGGETWKQRFELSRRIQRQWTAKCGFRS